MHRILVLIEKTETGYSAYAPDLPGCVAAGGSLEETEQLMHEALEMHIEDMATQGEPIPEATHVAAEFFMVRGAQASSSAA